MSEFEVGFLGGGKMASALCKGAIVEGVLKESTVVVAEPNAAQRKQLADQFPAATIVATAEEMIPRSKRVVLAVKPNVLLDIAPHLTQLISTDQLLVSIVAGISLAQLQESLGTKRIVRVMPNTPAQVGCGASGISADGHLSETDMEWVQSVMSSVGTCYRVPDKLLHAVTAVSGSGPAYAYMMIEAMSDGGVAMGLPREMATELAAQTLLGAAEMVLQTRRHPGALKDEVTSPGGTTIAAIRTLEQNGLRSALMEAIATCHKRSCELSQPDK